MEKEKLGGVVFPLVTPFCGNVINLSPSFQSVKKRA